MKLWTYSRYIRAFGLLLLVIAMIAVFASTDNYLKPTSGVYELVDGWDIYVNDTKQSSDSLLTSDVGVISYPDSVTISRILPKYPLVNPCVTTYTMHSVMDVYLDDTLIYSYGHDYFDNDRTVPKKYHYFPLGYDYAGKKLSIVIQGTRHYSFTGLSPVSIGTRSDLLTLHAVSIRHIILIGMFLIVLGIALIILSPYMVIYHTNDLRLFFSGLISLLLGLYIFSFYRIIDLICNNPDLNTVCEYSSLYNIPTAILGYLMAVYSGKLKKIFITLLWINIAVFLTVFIMCVFGNSKIFEFTSLLYSMAFIESIISIIVIIRDFIKKRKEKKKRTFSSDNVFAVGLILFMLFSLIDMIRYNYYKFIGNIGTTFTSIGLFVIGSLIFVSGLLISYLLYIIYNANLDSMQSKMASLAYTDPLTGLANRARCEQVMALLTEEHANYTIISLDLNKLKLVNDTLGHHEGDRLIAGFATILSDCFMDANLVGRMGGDEFIVILTEERALNTTRRIHEFYSLINDWNHKEQNFSYSASYGYAYSYEVPSGSAQEVYMLADSRMYEMKREHQADRQKGVIKNAKATIMP